MTRMTNNRRGRGVIITPTDDQWEEMQRRSGNKNPKHLLRILIQQLVEQYGLRLLDLAPANLQPRGHLPSPQPQPLSADVTEPDWGQVDAELNARVNAMLKSASNGKPSTPPATEPAKKPNNKIPICYLLDREFNENFNKAFAECEPYVKEFYEKTNMIRIPMHEVANIVYKFSNPNLPAPRSPTEKNTLELIYRAYRIWWIATYGDKPRT